MKKILILNTIMVNEGVEKPTDILINQGKIEKIANNLIGEDSDYVIDAQGKYILPGIIDDQVHFREPGLTHKAEIYTEAKAAVSGGVTSFMEMPNTKPPSLTRELLEEKYQKASQVSLANYSFYMGVSNDNAEEAVKVDPRQVCGLKVFMGSSTGNMLVDDEQTLNNIFSKSPILIATHCEDEATVRENMKTYREKYGEEMPIRFHPKVRSVEACLKSSSLAVELAKKHKSRLHVLHISTEEELDLFTNLTPLEKKLITAEVCVHHLYFDAEQYDELGNQIKCNPAIKVSRHRDALWKALMDNRLDIIATDHAPHTWEEKDKNYWEAPSGLPLVQHSLYIMLEFYRQGKISLAKIVEKMCHAPAICFQLENRGFIREGYWADLVLVDLKQEYKVTQRNILHKCGWSPFMNRTFPGLVTHTFVSGHLAYHKGNFDESKMGLRLHFDR